jgi:predicted patatin/cPLA2 family phospholipase
MDLYLICYQSFVNFWNLTLTKTRDYIGFLTYIDSQGLINSGSFILDRTNLMILFTDNDEFIFEFSEGDSQENLIVDFTEDGTNYTQTWVKLE